MMFLNLVSTSVCPGKYVCCKNSKGQSKASEDRYLKKNILFCFYCLKRMKGLRAIYFIILTEGKIESWIKTKNPSPFLLAAVCYPTIETYGLEFFTVILEIQFNLFIFGHNRHRSNCNTTSTRCWYLWVNQTREGGRWQVIKEESWCLHLEMCTLCNQLGWRKRQKRPVTV